MPRSESEEEAVAAYQAAPASRSNGGRSLFLKVAGAVSLAVVAAAVLFPVVVGSPGGISFRAQGMSNMKQLMLGLTQYMQDSDGTLPPANSADGHGWREAIYPFVQSPWAYSIPDDEDKRRNTPDDLPRSIAANHIGPDGQGVERGAFALTGERRVTLAQFTDPSAMIMLVSVRGIDGEYWNTTDAAFLPQTGRELFAQKPRHAFYEHPSGVVLFAFLDGHVKAIPKPTETLTPKHWTRNNAPFAGQDSRNAQIILKYAEDE